MMNTVEKIINFQEVNAENNSTERPATTRSNKIYMSKRQYAKTIKLFISFGMLIAGTGGLCILTSMIQDNAIVAWILMISGILIGATGLHISDKCIKNVWSRGYDDLDDLYECK